VQTRRGRDASATRGEPQRQRRPLSCVWLAAPRGGVCVRRRRPPAGGGHTVRHSRGDCKAGARRGGGRGDGGGRDGGEVAAVPSVRDGGGARAQRRRGGGACAERRCRAAAAAAGVTVGSMTAAAAAAAYAVTVGGRGLGRRAPLRTASAPAPRERMPRGAGGKGGVAAHGSQHRTGGDRHDDGGRGGGGALGSRALPTARAALLCGRPPLRSVAQMLPAGLATAVQVSCHKHS